jgi:hypothetical protein
MIKTPLFLAYGMLVLALTGYAEYHGWSWSRVNQQRVLPESIRDNPGAYRSSYGGYSRYVGGK